MHVNLNGRVFDHVYCSLASVDVLWSIMIVPRILGVRMGTDMCCVLCVIALCHVGSVYAAGWCHRQVLNYQRPACWKRWLRDSYRSFATWMLWYYDHWAASTHSKKWFVCIRSNSCVGLFLPTKGTLYFCWHLDGSEKSFKLTLVKQSATAWLTVVYGSPWPNGWDSWLVSAPAATAG